MGPVVTKALYGKVCSPLAGETSSGPLRTYVSSVVTKALYGKVCSPAGWGDQQQRVPC